jgi:hypothetical protein
LFVSSPSVHELLVTRSMYAPELLWLAASLLAVAAIAFSG